MEKSVYKRIRTVSTVIVGIFAAIATSVLTAQSADASDYARFPGWGSGYHDRHSGYQGNYYWRNDRHPSRYDCDGRRPPRNYHKPKPRPHYPRPYALQAPKPRPAPWRNAAIRPSCPSGTRYDGRSCIIVDQRLRKPGGDGRINPCPKGMWNSNGTCVGNRR